MKRLSRKKLVKDNEKDYIYDDELHHGYAHGDAGEGSDVIEGEVVEPQDDTEVTDSTMLDSLAADTLKLPWPESVQVGIGKLLESKMFETSQVGIMVWDMDADSCIYKHNERQLMRPASTMKLLTAITALDKLGGSYQFKTQLKYTGTIEDGVLTGDVYCVGGMDPCFNSDDRRHLSTVSRIWVWIPFEVMYMPTVR